MTRTNRSPAASRMLWRNLGIAAVIAATSALGGCASRGFQAKADLAEIPVDHRERHPVVVGDVRQTLDVFLVPNSGMDHRQVQDLRAFVREFRANGKGALVASLPPNAPAGAVQYTLREIRKVAGGVPMSVTSGPTHPTAASIRLSYAALDAKVGSQCGQWPHDPAGGNTLQGWANRPLYNLGCSQQSMLAAQAANPLDHVRPRIEGPSDIEKRMKNIKDFRQGTDPSTNWKTQTTSIGSI